MTALVTSIASSRQTELAVRIGAHQPLMATGKTVHKARPSSTLKIRVAAGAPGVANGGSSKGGADAMKDRPSSTVYTLNTSSPMRQHEFDRASSALIMTSPTPSCSRAPPGRRASRAEETGRGKNAANPRPNSVLVM